MVIDASGIWRRPNPISADGRRVAVIGSGHSAQNVVRDLARLAAHHRGTEVTWLVRRTDPGLMFGGDRADQLPERGRLGATARALVDGGQVALVTGFRTSAVRSGPDGVVLEAEDGSITGPFDQTVAATGFRPDLTFLSELRVDVDPALESARALAPLIDPNVHSCGSVPAHGAAQLAQPEPGLFLVGAESYGRAPTFRLATGYEQVRSVVARLAGDEPAAAEVHLHLPETGVCSLDRSGADATTSCCAPEPVVATSLPDTNGVTCPCS